MSQLSTNLIEMATEYTDPALWAALQISKGGRADMTMGEAMDMIQRIVRESWEMQRTKEAAARPTADAERASVPTVTCLTCPNCGASSLHPI